MNLAKVLDDCAAEMLAEEDEKIFAKAFPIASTPQISLSEIKSRRFQITVDVDDWIFPWDRWDFVPSDVTLTPDCPNKKGPAV